MISAWHLLWIVPLAVTAGAFCMAIVAGGDNDPEWYDDYPGF